MKLAYITNTGLTEGWAHSIQIMNMCKAFSGIGVNITLIVPNRSYLKENPFEHFKIVPIFIIKKLPCIDLFPGNPHPFFYWLRLISFYISARFYVWFNKFDSLYSRDLYSVLFFPSVILEQHSFQKNTHTIFRLTFNPSRKIVALTSFIKNKFVNMGVSKNNVLVSPSGVDLDEFQKLHDNFEIAGLSKENFVIGYIGTLKTLGMEKGVADGLKALTMLSTGYRFLVVGGEKPDVDYYKEMSVSLKILERVIFLGQVSHTDIAKYASRCDCFIAPFPENKHYKFYMSPLKIFEYMAGRKPIIASDMPSLKEVLINNQNAILVPPNNPQALAQAIIRIKKDPEYGKKLADKAYSDVSEKYTWKIRAEKIISFLNK